MESKNKRYTWLPVCYKKVNCCKYTKCKSHRRCQVVSSPASHSGNPGFKSWQGDGHSWGSPWFYQSSKQILGQQLKFDHHQSPKHPFELTIHESSWHSTLETSRAYIYVYWRPFYIFHAVHYSSIVQYQPTNALKLSQIYNNILKDHTTLLHVSDLTGPSSGCTRYREQPWIIHMLL